MICCSCSSSSSKQLISSGRLCFDLGRGTSNCFLKIACTPPSLGQTRTNTHGTCGAPDDRSGRSAIPWTTAGQSHNAEMLNWWRARHQINFVCRVGKRSFSRSRNCVHFPTTTHRRRRTTNQLMAKTTGRNTGKGDGEKKERETDCDAAADRRSGIISSRPDNIFREEEAVCGERDPRIQRGERKGL